MSLTQKQESVLEYYADRSRVAGVDANYALNGPRAEATGFHQTAASLVHRGYLEKSKVKGTVHYEATTKGREYVRAQRSLRRQAGQS